MTQINYLRVHLKILVLASLFLFWGVQSYRLELQQLYTLGLLGILMLLATATAGYILLNRNSPHQFKFFLFSSGVLLLLAFLSALFLNALMFWDWYSDHTDFGRLTPTTFVFSNFVFWVSALYLSVVCIHLYRTNLTPLYFGKNHQPLSAKKSLVIFISQLGGIACTIASFASLTWVIIFFINEAWIQAARIHSARIHAALIPLALFIAYSVLTFTLFKFPRFLLSLLGLSLTLPILALWGSYLLASAFTTRVFDI